MNLSEAYFENAQPRASKSRFEGYIITLANSLIKYFICILNPTDTLGQKRRILGFIQLSFQFTDRNILDNSC